MCTGDIIMYAYYMYGRQYRSVNCSAILEKTVGRVYVQ